MVRMQVSGVYASAKSAYPQVVLEQVDGGAYLPIVIGRFEAAAISMAQSDKEPVRPISYDLARAILESVGVRLQRVEITELHEGTYFAEVHIEDREGEVLVMDSRPSDAIALALRMSAPIFASPEVLREAGYVQPDEAEVSAGRAGGGECSTTAQDGAEAQDVASRDDARGIEAEEVSPLEVLRRRLREAVAEEVYEEAARLRDEISGLEADESA